MSNEKLDQVSEGLWNRARTICISMMQGDAKRSRAERNFSMINSVMKDGSIFKIMAINKLTAEMLEKEYGDDIRKSFQLAGAENGIEVKFEVDEINKPTIVVNKLSAKKTETAKTSQTQEVFISTMPLKEYYTFEEFVEGPSNSYVLAAAKGVAKNPGQKALNPLLI